MPMTLPRIRALIASGADGEALVAIVDYIDALERRLYDLEIAEAEKLMEQDPTLAAGACLEDHDPVARAVEAGVLQLDGDHEDDAAEDEEDPDDVFDHAGDGVPF